MAENELNTNEQQLICPICDTRKVYLLSIKNIDNKHQELRLLCPTCGTMDKLFVEGRVKFADELPEEDKIKLKGTYLS